MSYNNILKLANKFSVKLADANQTDKQQVFDKFKSELRAILNEMEGDMFTLKIKGMDRNILKEMITVYSYVREKYKSLDIGRANETIDDVLAYILSKPVKTLLVNLHALIQKFLKENEVQFEDHDRFSQARIDSIEKLLKLASTMSKRSQPQAPETLQTENEEYQPTTTQEAGTKVEKKL